MRKKAELVSIGDKFNRWTVISELIKTKDKRSSFLAVCDCGKEKMMDFSKLASGRSKSCGCLLVDTRRQALIERHKLNAGKKFNRLTIKNGNVFNGPDGRPIVDVVCDCGTEITIGVYGLVRGDIKSCGCLRSDTSKLMAIARNTTHGNSNHDLYQIWTGIIKRCTNPRHKAYSMYGARGITVCDRWKASFEDFVSDVGDRPSPNHSIDRIDNDAGYSPDNCRWATQTEQCRNTRRNRVYEINGEEKSLVEWCAIYNAKYGRVIDRLEKLGWPILDALTKPIQKHHKNSVLITVNGETKCAAEWARENGLEKSAVSSRLKNGWPEELAATAPKSYRYANDQHT